MTVNYEDSHDTEINNNELFKAFKETMKMDGGVAGTFKLPQYEIKLETLKMCRRILSLRNSLNSKTNL